MVCAQPPRSILIPRLFNKRVATLRMAMLRACEQKGGYRHPYDLGARTGRFSWYKFHERKAINHLYTLGWITMRPSGPRGGARWHPTETGQLVLDIIAQSGPAYKAQFLLLFGRWK